MVKSCLNNLSFCLKNATGFIGQRSLLHLPTKPIAFFDEVLNEKPHTFSLLLRRECVRFIYIHCGLIPLNGIAISASLVVFQSVGEGGGIASEAEVIACVWCKHNRATHVEAMEVALQ